MVFGFGIPQLVQEQSIQFGTILKFVYEKPSNASDYTDALLGRKQRTATRWEVYSRLEEVSDKYGFVLLLG
jgi:hypothetical protein